MSAQADRELLKLWWLYFTCIDFFPLCLVSLPIIIYHCNHQETRRGKNVRFKPFKFCIGTLGPNCIKRKNNELEAWGPSLPMSTASNVSLLFHYFFILFYFLAASWGVQNFPAQGSNPCLLQWKRRFVTPGPPGKSTSSITKDDYGLTHLAYQ